MLSRIRIVTSFITFLVSLIPASALVALDDGALTPITSEWIIAIKESIHSPYDQYIWTQEALLRNNLPLFRMVKSQNTTFGRADSDGSFNKTEFLKKLFDPSQNLITVLKEMGNDEEIRNAPEKRELIRYLLVRNTDQCFTDELHDQLSKNPGSPYVQQIEEYERNYRSYENYPFINELTDPISAASIPAQNSRLQHLLKEIILKLGPLALKDILSKNKTLHWATHLNDRPAIKILLSLCPALAAGEAAELIPMVWSLDPDLFKLSCAAATGSAPEDYKSPALNLKHLKLFGYVRPFYGYWPLMKAAAEGNVEKVRELVSSGAITHANDSDHYRPHTCVHYAIPHPAAYEMIKIILEAPQTNPRKLVQIGNPLFDSVIKGDLRLVSLLLKHGAPVDASSFNAATMSDAQLLWNAVEDKTKFLSTFSSETPITALCKKLDHFQLPPESTKLLQELINAGASVTQENHKNKSPLKIMLKKYARHPDCPEFVKILLCHGAGAQLYHSQPHAHINATDPVHSVIKKFTSFWYNFAAQFIDTFTKHEWTGDCAPLQRLLLNTGSTHTQSFLRACRDSQNDTLLHHAVKNNNHHAMRILLQLCPPLAGMINAEGKSPMQYCGDVEAFSIFHSAATGTHFTDPSELTDQPLPNESAK